MYVLVTNHRWQVAITHVQSLPVGDAVDQIFYQDQYGVTTIMRACWDSAPLELVQLMITKAKLDSRKRCLLAITEPLDPRLTKARLCKDVWSVILSFL